MIHSLPPFGLILTTPDVADQSQTPVAIPRGLGSEARVLPLRIPAAAAFRCRAGRHTAFPWPGGSFFEGTWKQLQGSGDRWLSITIGQYKATTHNNAQYTGAQPSLRWVRAILPSCLAEAVRRGDWGLSPPNSLAKQIRRRHPQSALLDSMVQTGS